jgi:uncharacterized protein (TIGR00251 family)
MGLQNGSLKLRITAAPVDGKANIQAIRVLAEAFDVANSAVTIKRGDTSRIKIFRIASPGKIPAELLKSTSG